MKRIACVSLALTMAVLLMNPAYSEARGRHGGGHGGWWMPWAIIGGAAILTSHLARSSTPVPVIIREETPAPVPPPSSLTVPEERVFIYPRQGQSEALQARDRYECHLWAVDRTGCDPTQPSTGSMPKDRLAQVRADYFRAQAACLEGRGYTMR